MWQQVVLRWCSRAAEMVHAHHLMMVSRDTLRRKAADFRASAAAQAALRSISDASK